MALSWVKVIGAAGDVGRDIFVNGNLIDAAGTIGNPFQVESGQNTFALLQPDKSIDRSITMVIDLHSDETAPQLVDMSGVAVAAVTMAPAAKPRRARRRGRKS